MWGVAGVRAKTGVAEHVVSGNPFPDTFSVSGGISGKGFPEITVFRGFDTHPLRPYACIPTCDLYPYSAIPKKILKIFFGPIDKRA